MSNGRENGRRSAAVTDADADADRAELLDSWAGRIATAVAPNEISFAGLTARVYAGGGRGRRGLLRSAPAAPGGAGGELATLLPTLWHALAVSYDLLVAALGSAAVSNAVSGAALLLALEERQASRTRGAAPAPAREASGAPARDASGTPGADGGPDAARTEASGAAPAEGSGAARTEGSGTAPAVGSGGGETDHAPVRPTVGEAGGVGVAGGVGATDLAVLAGAVVHVSRCLQAGGMARRPADRAAAQAVAALYEGRDAGAAAFLGILAGHLPPDTPASASTSASASVPTPPPAPARSPMSAVRGLRRRLATRLSGRGPGLPAGEE